MSRADRLAAIESGLLSPWANTAPLITTTKALSDKEAEAFRADATAGAITLTLPAANAAKDAYMRRVDLTQNALVIQASGADKLMMGNVAASVGMSQTQLLFAGDWLHLRSDGAGRWWCVGQAQLHDRELQGGLPLVTMPYPTVMTGDGRITVTAEALAGSGGRVSMPAGVAIALAEELQVGATARPCIRHTKAWSSPALAANSTFYLRANVQGGELVVYVGPGTDSDPIPASQRTKGDDVACGYDSTAIDVLLARVVTGAAGTAPTITSLANKAVLRVDAAWYRASGSYSQPLNWARKPRGYVTSFADPDGSVKTDYGVIVEYVGLNESGSVMQPAGGFSDRYTGRILIAAFVPSVGNGLLNAAVRWEA